MRRKQQWQKELLQSAESLEAADVLSVKKQLKNRHRLLGQRYYRSDCQTVGVITGVYPGKFELLRIFRFTYGQISCIIEPHESGENPASVFPQR